MSTAQIIQFPADSPLAVFNAEPGPAFQTENERLARRAHTIGSKYEQTRDLDIAEIAKLIRKDIAATIKNGDLPGKAEMKVTVRISRFSMGQSIDVNAKLLDRAARVTDDNPESVAYGRGYPGSFAYTHEALAIDHKLQAIVDAYNYDNSDSLTDYHENKFYGMVSVTGLGQGG